MRIVYNATTRTNETAEINRTTWAWINVTIANGANWTYTYAFSISYVGLWKIQFLLFKDGHFFSPYRKLQFYTTVTSAPHFDDAGHGDARGSQHFAERIRGSAATAPSYAVARGATWTVFS